MHAGDPNELVRLDLTFADETWATTEPLARYMAERILRTIGEHDQQPKLGTRVTQGLIRPLVEDRNYPIGVGTLQLSSVQQYAPTPYGEVAPLGRKTQVRIGDVMVSVSEEDFTIEKEDWNEYRLLDGGTIKVKTTVQRIFRVLDARGKPKIDADGDPEVLVRHSSQVVATDK
jgi:hypothetical protein